MKPKIIVVLGQTSTGKSDLAVAIAQKYNGEVISADSRQVYKGLDLGTGKITKKEKRGIPHHLLDVANPKNKFSVTEYQELTNSAIAEIVNRGKIPILCGGTGFYLDAITKNIVFPEVPPNIKLRKILNQKTALELFQMLAKLDKQRARDIKNKNEQNNKVRLIRAIEISKHLGKVPKIKKQIAKYDFIKIGLSLDDTELKDKIHGRLLARIKKGMVKEAISLHQKGLSWKRMLELGLEYRYLALYLQKKITKKEMEERLTTEIVHYAKRQKTWFKKDSEIVWFHPKEISKIEKYLKNKIRKN